MSSKNRKYYYNKNNYHNRRKQHSNKKHNDIVTQDEVKEIVGSNTNALEESNVVEELIVNEINNVVNDDVTSDVNDIVTNDEIHQLEENTILFRMVSVDSEDVEKIICSDNAISNGNLIDTNIVEENIEAPTEDVKENDKSNVKYYIGYYGRLAIAIGILLTLLAITILFVINVFDVSKENYFNYSEYSNVDYKVKLKDNNFYEEEYLDKDMIYVASLIDNITINFNYRFLSENNLNVNFKYNIYAKLVITDFNDKNVYYEKTYNLIPDKEVLLNNDTAAIITESLNINYDEYNRIANNFKNSYALSTKSKLVIYFNVNKNMANNVNAFIDSQNTNMFLEIPLSEKSINIELNHNDINNTNKIILNKKNGIRINKLFAILSVLSLLAFILVLIKVLKLVSCLFISKSAYDEYIDKILNEYDRLIVKTITPPIKRDTDKDRIIKVESFEELLDVRDNVKQPIMYYVITKHVKCQFYINSGDKIYITTIKKVDIEAENEKA